MHLKEKAFRHGQFSNKMGAPPHWLVSFVCQFSNADFLQIDRCGGTLQYHDHYFRWILLIFTFVWGVGGDIKGSVFSSSLPDIET